MLLLVGGFFLFQNYVNREKFATDLTSQSLTPVQKYVLSCVDKSLQSGLLLAASQGGYVQVPDEIERNPRLFVNSHPDAPIKTPIWLNGGKSFIPTYELIAQQLARHIDVTIGYCLKNLSTLTEISAIEELSTPVARVQINERDVTAYLNYTVSYLQGDAQQEISEFTYILSVPFKSMMESAKDVARVVTESQFFELATIDLLSSSDPTIPLTNMEISCKKPTWQVSDVKGNISQLLYQMIPRVRMAGGENTPFSASTSSYESLQRITPDDFSEPASGANPIKQKVPRGYSGAPDDVYEFNHLYIDTDIGGKLQKAGVTVSFDYEPVYGLDMEVRPSDGTTMSGSSGAGENKYLRFICIQVYHFTYDLQFPIQASIVKENAFKDGTSLVLRFALPVQIQRNLPNKKDFSVTSIEANVPGGKLCDDSVPYQTTVRAVNKATGDFIENANVAFHCYKYACNLGSTNTADSFSPQLVTAIPSFCSGGSVSVTHPDFVEAEEYFYTAPNLVQLEMFPLKNISYSVALGPNPAVYTQTSPSELNQNQAAAIHLTSNQIDYETYGAFKPGEQNVLQLVAGAGTYNLTVLVYETPDGEEASLVGGYIGELRVRNSDLNRQLLLYARDYINPVPSDEVAGKLAELANDSIIISSHAPGWG